MARWEVRAKDRAAQIDAPNWLVALGLALEDLALDPEAMTRMVCDVREDGSLRVREPLSGDTIALRRVSAPQWRAAAAQDWGQVEEIFALEPQPEEPKRPAPGAARFALADADPGDEESVSDHTTGTSFGLDDDLLDSWGEPTGEAPPPLSMPAPRVEAPPEEDFDPFFDEPEDLLDSDARVPSSVQLVLLERGLEIAAARRPAEAADLALTVLRQVVPAESGLVLLHNRAGLLFLAAQGPRATKLLGSTVPGTMGIAGFVATRGEPLLLHNPDADIRHDPGWDARTGLRTRAVLAVPLRDTHSQVRGCLHLSNPPSRFLPWHLEAAQSVAVALAEALRALGG